MESLVDEIPADPLFLLFGDFERGSPLQKLVLLGLAAKVGEIFYIFLTKFLWNCSKLPAMMGMGRDMTSTPQMAHMLPTSWIVQKYYFTL